MNVADIGSSQATALPSLAVDVYGQERSLNLLQAIRLLRSHGGRYRAVALIRLAQHFDRPRRRRFRDWANRQLRRDFGCFVQPGAQIGPGLKLPHPSGIVIGTGARIGSNCTIYHQVTLGGARRGDFKANRYPSVGDDVVLYAGAKLLGGIRVGNHVEVGANAVVRCDVPDNSVAVGIPARIISRTATCYEQALQAYS
ncbi:serine O-acetyltransferase [Sphingomonas sp. IW22]|jgi:serine O-acetyltransferase|uniref:serine O-acetyltransferase n=1 Tax=Sphingomonas sp. IW22 TaxID=3242489 RepID=UPI00352089DA